MAFSTARTLAAFCRILSARERGLSRRRWRRRLLPQLQVIDRVDDVGPDARLQLVEHPRSFDLVFDQRIALAIRAQPDSLAQIVDCGEMGNP
jgi:hypothetical protein